MGLSEARSNDMTGAKIYAKDNKAYYGSDAPVEATEFNVAPKIIINKEANNRYLGKDIYKPDQKPYYGTGVGYKVLSNAPVGMKSVPVQLDDLKNTYADPKNIKILENELEKITKKESLNSASLSGKYIPDAAPYYDPSAAEKRTKAEDISAKIANMKMELAKDQKGPVFTEENFKITKKIQNYANLNREATNELIKNSYYYEAKAKEGKFILFKM
jgi:hypothetical protein